MEKTAIKAVIFDMGGVILRTTDKEPRTKLGERFGKTYFEMDELVYGGESGKLATFGTISEEAHYAFVLSQFGLSMHDAGWFFDAFWGGDTKDQELVDFIYALKENYTTALLSNAWSGARASVEPRYQFLGAFDFSVFSAEIKMAKPNHDIYLWLLDQIKVKPEEAIFVDDMPHNIEAANAVGIHGIQFRSTEQVIADINALLT